MRHKVVTLLYGAFGWKVPVIAHMGDENGVAKFCKENNRWIIPGENDADKATASGILAPPPTTGYYANVGAPPPAGPDAGAAADAAASVAPPPSSSS